jgi:hypothetical protein
MTNKNALNLLNTVARLVHEDKLKPLGPEYFEFETELTVQEQIQEKIQTFLDNDFIVERLEKEEDDSFAFLAVKSNREQNLGGRATIYLEPFVTDSGLWTMKTRMHLMYKFNIFDAKLL